MNRNTQTLVSGCHHDGRVEVELKQLTGAGERLYENPEMCAAPRFMERCFGAVAQERGSGERDHAVEAGAPEPPVPVTELDMEDRGDAR